MKTLRDPKRNRFVSFIAETVATGFGSGLWPFVAPATVGTAAAVLLYWLLPYDGDGDSVWFFLTIAGFVIAGTWATDYISTPDDHDPKRGVIDEWAGVWVTLAFLPVTWSWLLAGFVTFRVLDVLKPLGVRRLEKLPGGVGVMADDLAAGVIGAAGLNVVRLIFFD